MSYPIHQWNVQTLMCPFDKELCFKYFNNDIVAFYFRIVVTSYNYQKDIIFLYPVLKMDLMFSMSIRVR